jgi:hypothetical protein
MADSRWLLLGATLLPVGVTAAVGLPSTGMRGAWLLITVGASAIVALSGLYCIGASFLHLPLPPLRDTTQVQAQQPTTAHPSDEDVALDEDHEKLLLRLYEYEGKCAISAPTGEYECLWVPGFITSMQWGWERTPQEAAISGKPRGNRTERMHWLFVVKDLVERGFLQETSTPQVFELTTDGQRLAYTLDRARQQ